MIKAIELMYGTDPEAFLSRDGKIIGSERVLPPNEEKRLRGVVRDGVQVEFNPPAAAKIQALGDGLRAALGTLTNHLRGYPGVELDWRGIVEVERAELSSLCPENRVLGCQPSENSYGVKPIRVGEDYPKRSAGGHLHFGRLPLQVWTLYVGEDRRAQLVPLFDIFVGNTAVLLDREPGQAERRENYGRAGEFRKQPHGIEYRTPSNFWMRHSSLMDLVFGMGAFAVAVSSDTADGGKVEYELADVVDIDAFIQAIDLNSYALARRNFEALVPFLRKHLPESGYPLTPKNLDHFLSFSEAVNGKGIESYFPAKPEVYWANEPWVGFADLMKKYF